MDDAEYYELTTYQNPKTIGDCISNGRQRDCECSRSCEDSLEEADDWYSVKISEKIMKCDHKEGPDSRMNASTVRIATVEDSV